MKKSLLLSARGGSALGGYLFISLFCLFLITGCGKTVYTPATLLENQDELVDQRLLITGEAENYRLNCTREECAQDDKCCQSCGSKLSLVGDGARITIKGDFQGKKVHCEGTNCELNCYPLEENNEYKITGIWRKVDVPLIGKSDYHLEIIEFE